MKETRRGESRISVKIIVIFLGQRVVQEAKAEKDAKWRKTERHLHSRELLISNGIGELTEII